MLLLSSMFLGLLDILGTNRSWIMSLHQKLPWSLYSEQSTWKCYTAYPNHMNTASILPHLISPMLGLPLNFLLSLCAVQLLGMNNSRASETWTGRPLTRPAPACGWATLLPMSQLRDYLRYSISLESWQTVLYFLPGLDHLAMPSWIFAMWRTQSEPMKHSTTIVYPLLVPLNYWSYASSLLR